MGLDGVAKVIAGECGSADLVALGEALDLVGAVWFVTGSWALRFRRVSYEEPRVVWVFNDIFRHMINDFGGVKIRFFKVRKSLLNFGFSRVGNLNVADVERAVLDILYITLPSNPNSKEWSYIAAGFLKPCRKEKLLEYLKHYPKNVEKVVKYALNRIV